MPAQNLKEETALEQFRKEVFEEGILREGDTLGTDDETLLRFLRARRLSVPASKKMLSDCQEWRKTAEGVGIDELYKRIDPFDYPERKAVFDCWPMWFHKTDKKGRPLNVHFFGGMDLNKLFKECTPEKHWQTVLVNAESLTREILPAASRKAGRPINNVFVIVDLKGFGLSQFWQMKALAQRSFQISQDYYPETMGQLAIVNAPSSFTFIWSMIRPWLSKETAEKVDILGSDYKDVLLRLVDEDALPSVLGGKCTCQGIDGASDDGNECHLSGAGPWLDGRVGWGPKSHEAKDREEDVESAAPSTDGGPPSRDSHESAGVGKFALANGDALATVEENARVDRNESAPSIKAPPEVSVPIGIHTSSPSDLAATTTTFPSSAQDLETPSSKFSSPPPEADTVALDALPPPIPLNLGAAVRS
ncbi:hypothetical protein HGRIS_006045 [Hohenbuehelia grisea]|uniref:CRAL-TRIO domain-containing protein n=1 Tax=Hohenbuehelia grisea TaxID=104357 RepID=A0ABR3JZI9_9AGAR